MGTLRLCTRVRAPRERCFDLSRSVDLHVESTAATGEHAVGGVTSGLLSLGDEVTWRARHLGVWQTLTSRITQLDRPLHFRDSMIRGAFARFDHDHFFEVDGETCVMREVFDYRAPLGPLGFLVEKLFLDGYLREFLRQRNVLIQKVAESEAWRNFLPADAPGFR